MNDQSESKPEEKNAPATVGPEGKSGSNKIIFIALAVFALGLVATFLVAQSGDDGGGSTGETAQTSETDGNQGSNEPQKVGQASQIVDKCQDVVGDWIYKPDQLYDSNNDGTPEVYLSNSPGTTGKSLEVAFLDANCEYVYKGLPGEHCHGLTCIYKPSSGTTDTNNTSTANPNPAPPTSSRTDLIEVGTLSDRYVEWTDPSDFARYANHERWLYFHANWCPKCIALNRDIESNADQIPEDLVIFKVDFDREEDLKQNYGVRFQTTVLRVDSQGDPEREFVGATEGHTLAELLGILR